MAYHFNLRITRWPLTFRQERKNALLDMSRIQQTVVLDLHTSNILIIVLPNIDQLISKTCRLEGNQRILKTKRYTENTLYRRKIDMVNAPRCSSSRIRCIQKAHIAFRTCFGGKAEKYDRQGRKIQEAEKKQAKTVYRQNISFQKKGILHHKSLPLSNCLFWSVDHAVIA